MRDSEAAYRDLLVWLLNPSGSHGLADKFLRRFLGAIGFSNRGRIFHQNLPLRGEVMREFAWDVPQDEEFVRVAGGDKSEGVRQGLRVDVFVALPGVVMPIELKVGAGESQYRFRGVAYAQLAMYGEMFRLMTAEAKLARTNGSGLSKLPWLGAFRRGLEKHNQQGVERLLFQDGDPRVVPVLIDRTSARSHDTPDRKHLRWLEIDRILFHLTHDEDLEPTAVGVLNSFRAAILSKSMDYNLLHIVQDLRLRIAAPEIVERFPVESAERLRVAIEKLGVGHHQRAIRRAPSSL